MTTSLLAFSTRVADGEQSYSRREVIYARKAGMALTMDVFSPEFGSNGAAVIFAVSEGWYSDHDKITPNISGYVEPLLARGYTVFAVCHGSNPKFTLPEIIEDIHRSVRFIRHNAREYKIDPDRIGMTGDSAGGHLSLMMGCAGQKGDPAALDPVDRESSRVKAVVAFFPPTDFLNWGETGTRMLGTHPTVPIQAVFDFHRFDSDTNRFERITAPDEREAIGKQVSPISHVQANSAPTLIFHGDRDSLIPVQQSVIMAAELKRAGVLSELIVVPGGEHDETLVQGQMPKALDWFDQYLATNPKTPILR